MLRTLKIITGIVYFILPVGVSFLQMVMFVYLLVSLQSGAQGVLYGLSGLAAGIYLLASIGFKPTKLNNGLSVLALVVMLVPVVTSFVFSYSWLNVLMVAGYVIMFILILVTLILSVAQYRKMRIEHFPPRRP